MAKQNEPGRPAAAAAAAADSIIAAMGDGLILLSMEGKISSVNPAFEKMMGYEKSEFVGKDVADTIPKTIKPEEMKKIMGVLGQFLDEKTPTPSLIVTAVSKDGREIPVSITSSIVKDAEGKPTNVVITLKDITELKRAEEELKEKVKDLEDFHEVAVGRELRMAELEEEIEKLKGR